jgi:protease II
VVLQPRQRDHEYDADHWGGHFYLRTISSRVITHWLRRPRALAARARFWLAAHTDSLDEKRRCLEAIRV